MNISTFTDFCRGEGRW